ncbi:hypothetical protein SAMN04487761_1455 [Lachnospiraceae bacterium C7]|nr:hypothetical protein SAMN04487761_1455 [Lachnospiraceae bacterium C7]
MAVRGTIIKELEDIYSQDGNQIVILYGKQETNKQSLIKSFLENKKFFYYRCRQASELEQKRLMGNEISKKYNVRLTKGTYDEYFTRVKSGDPSKLVIVIDEFQYIVKKKNQNFLDSILKLKAKKLYPGPVMVILCCSSVTWIEQEMPETVDPKFFKKVNKSIKVDDLNFLDMVRVLPKYSVKDSIKVYGIIGGVYDYLDKWDENKSVKENVCQLILKKDGYLFDAAERMISYELRELSVYDTILCAIAAGHHKLNDLFHVTGYSRAKISVYMKNLSNFDVLEKVVSFQSGGWDNAKKGIYHIKDTYVNFWFKFIYPHLSDLYLMEPETFYDTYIEPDLDEYLERYFRNVCMEYLQILDQIGKLPFKVHKMGTWVGKTGNIDIIAQSSNRLNIVGLCNWNKDYLTLDMYEELLNTMEKAKLESDYLYFFSAKSFSKQLIELSEKDDRIELIDMNEL